ncbi:peptidylprolyl isomerase [Pseudoalteromonas sp. SCSIO 43201]|uniref:peptidylprolyl isomerase n=1 Tax=Pseudoalteromonas sp. SCSIO 43201 TaxID=2822842 RepID=UPI0020764186|nr:peptidylprolyl isomerase [Pseudoalteromonas sp. SCSIO 43201]USD27228.1 peptidylprolyl isomerase [Pseudoalteromonas sp. SCSIO 43201]
MFKLNTLLLASAMLGSVTANATIVEFQTSHGSFQVNLYDQSTPKTVENFLQYVNNERYSDTVIHRVIPEFVVQGGGFTYEGKVPLDAIETYNAVKNEPKWSNVKGTIAMAKVAYKPDSATSQWFINLEDNSSNLDVENGGYTVFGQVIGDGMEVLEAIAQIPRCGNVPLVNFTDEQCKDTETDPGAANFVTLNAITVLDDDPNSAVGLTQKANTLIDQVTDKPSTDQDSGSSGGSMFAGLFLLAAALGFRRRVK